MWRTEDHTADVSLLVESPSWPGLLAEAVDAYTGYSFPGPLPGAEETCELSVEAPDRVALWVAWWRGLLRLTHVKRLFPAQVCGLPEAGATTACGRLWTIPVEKLSPEILIEIKAITWHAAEVQRGAGGWSGRIVLDL